MRRTATCFATALAILSATIFTGADWTRFLGPNGDSTSTDKGLPDDWSGTSNIVWKTELPGFGSSCPITFGDKIFLTTYTGYGMGKGDTGKPEDLKRRLVCLERATGKIRWEKLAPAALPEQEYSKGMINLHGYSSSTPATDGNAIYVFYGRSGVYAYSLTGDELWHHDVGSKTHVWGSSNSPILAGNILVINASVECGEVIGLDKKTGEQKWQVKGIKQSWSTPALLKTATGKTELVVSIQGKVLGIDPATGEELWNCAGIEDYTCPTVMVHDDVAYISGARKAATLAVRGGGRGDVTKTHKLWDVKKGSLVPTPVYHDGMLYVVNQTGTALCLKADTGEVVYEQHVSGMKTVYASPLLVGDKLYSVSRETGAVVWAVGPEYKEISRPNLDDKSIFDATPVASNGQLLLRSDKFLYCIGK